MPISALAAAMAATASLSEAPGARLKLMVTEGNWSWWLMASGAVRRSMLGDRAQRHLRAAGGRARTARDSAPGSLWYCGMASSTTRYWLAWA